MDSLKPHTPKDSLRVINMLFYSMFFSVFFVGLVFFFLQKNVDPVIPEKDTVRIIFIISLFVASIILSIAERIFRKRIIDARNQEISLIEKLSIYRAAIIVFLAACEGVSMFALIFYFLTGSTPFLIFAAFGLIAMITKRPGRSRIFNDLQLSSEEQMNFN